MGDMNSLLAVSPIDGRYSAKTLPLRNYFSEYAFIRNRVRVEVEYFIALCGIPLPQLRDFGEGAGIGKEELFTKLRSLYLEMEPEEAARVKDIEKITNHDVKAVEYYLKEKFDGLGLSRWKEFIHFGLTSQDINNTAQPLMLKEALENEYIPALKEIVAILSADAQEWKDVPMLAKTHGQPATPTRLGKEIQVFVARLEEQLRQMDGLSYPAKFGGATGNMNAHKVAYPEIDWPAFADGFVASLGLKRSFPTTQIDHYDNLAAIFDCLRRQNTILIDLCRDIWTYISMEYFRQRVVKGEVGSSAMPHKVNPIDFENAEGNLGMADAVLTFLSMKLPLSRLQRDLTDSTVQRNIGVPLAHGMIAFASLKKGLGKLILNREAIDADLHRNWAVVAEALQTILRREGYPNPYETLKNLTRTGAGIDEKTIAGFIETLDVSEAVKEELRAVTPWTYTGF
jgi:adenylosuccinate lyase